MSLPVSVGDAILLAKISYNLGKAFTSGRRSAPAEFAEIQDLLYTLSTALDLVAKEFTPHDSVSESLVSLGLSDSHEADRHASHETDSDAVIGHCVSKCRITLGHLQALVNKYTELDPSSDTNASKRWKDGIKKNWKKITWTTEGAGLDKLKIALTAHINGINLAIAAHNKAQCDLTLRQAEVFSKKLDDVYELLANTLKDQHKAMSEGELSTSCIAEQRRLAFSIWSDTSKSSGRILRCSNASFRPGWTSSSWASQNKRVFECHCEHACEDSGEPCSKIQIHQRVLNLFLLPISLLVRVAGESSQREWQVYAGSTDSSSPVALVLDNIPPTMTTAFENAVNELSAAQARRYLHAKWNTAMISTTQDVESQTMMVLDLKPNVLNLFDKIYSATFEANGHRFTTPRIGSFQFLRYKCVRDVDLDLGDSVHEPLHAFRELSHINFTLHCLKMVDDKPADTWTIKIEQETRIRQGVNLCEVAFFNVACTALSHTDYSETESDSTIMCTTVLLSFADLNSAGAILDVARSMQRELSISYLRCQRWAEQNMFRRDLSDVVFRGRLLKQARLNVVLDPVKARYRLIISSACGSLTLCTKLPEDFLARVGAGNHVTDKGLTTWLVEITEDGTHIARYSGAGSFAVTDLLHGTESALRIEH